MIYLPLLIPLFGGLISLLGWRNVRLQRYAAVIFAGLLTICAVGLLNTVNTQGIQTARVGGWPSPFAIVLAADLFSAWMVLIGSFTALAVAVYSKKGIDEQRASFGFYPLFFFLLLGVNGAFLTADLFNLYVWFEVMLMSSFVLIALGGERAQLEGAIKYFIINLLASILFLSAIGLLYHYTGALNLADLAVRWLKIDASGITAVITVLFISAFGIKAGLFPLFFWLPASYHTPPVTITALFSGLLTKVGVYAIVRTSSLLFYSDPAFLSPLLITLAGLTMFTGVMGAAAQTDTRRLLSFHIISQIGYLLMGVGLFSQEALAGMIYFMPHVIFSKTALFLAAGMMREVGGSYELHDLGGLYRSQPGLAVLFIIPALSLAGLPPLSGFFAKFLLVSAGLSLSSYVIVFVSLVVSLLTLFSMTKIWLQAFWKNRETPEPQRVKLSSSLWVPALGLVIIIVLMGVFVGPLYDFSMRGAGQLIDTQPYIQAVLGGG